MFDPKEHIEIEKKRQEDLQHIWEKNHPEEAKRKKRGSRNFANMMFYS